MANKEFEAFNVGTYPIVLDEKDVEGKILKSLIPVKLFLKEDGALNDTPSIVIISIDERFTVVSQISLQMLNEGLADIGYELKKTE